MKSQQVPWSVEIASIVICAASFASSNRSQTHSRRFCKGWASMADMVLEGSCVDVNTECSFTLPSGQRVAECVGGVKTPTLKDNHPGAFTAGKLHFSTGGPILSYHVAAVFGAVTVVLIADIARQSWQGAICRRLTASSTPSFPSIISAVNLATLGTLQRNPLSSQVSNEAEQHLGS